MFDIISMNRSKYTVNRSHILSQNNGVDPIKINDTVKK